MKTELALLLLNEGNPTMPLKKVAELMGFAERTAENKIYDKTLGVPAFKLGSSWVVHVSDLASHIDSQRASATKALQRGAKSLS